MAVLAKYHPEWECQAPLSGLEEPSVAKLRDALPIESEELIELVSLYDFQCCDLFPFFVPINPNEYASKISKLIEIFDDANSIFDESFHGWTSSTLESCKIDASWRSYWIPIGQDNANYVFVDMDPSPSGIRGQIVEAHEDGKYLSVIASSFSHLLDRISNSVKSGDTVDSGYGGLYVARIDSHYTD